jgi:hypothetical protein
MWEDPIVAEVHKARENIFSRFNGNMNAYFQYLRERTEEERERGREVIYTPIGPSIVSRHVQQSKKPDAA